MGRHQQHEHHDQRRPARRGPALPLAEHQYQLDRHRDRHVGIAHNNWLLYGKAGAAVENVSYTENSAIAGIPLFGGTGTDKNRVGWTVGTGLEWAFWKNWSVKVEYDYLDFGNRNVAINGAITPGGAAIPASFGVQNQQKINEVKAGLNWRFAPNLW